MLLLVLLLLLLLLLQLMHELLMSQHCRAGRMLIGRLLLKVGHLISTCTCQGEAATATRPAIHGVRWLVGGKGSSGGSYCCHGVNSWKGD